MAGGCRVLRDDAPVEAAETGHRVRLRGLRGVGDNRRRLAGFGREAPGTAVRPSIPVERRRPPRRPGLPAAPPRRDARGHRRGRRGGLLRRTPGREGRPVRAGPGRLAVDRGLRCAPGRLGRAHLNHLPRRGVLAGAAEQPGHQPADGPQHRRGARPAVDGPPVARRVSPHDRVRPARAGRRAPPRHGRPAHDGEPPEPPVEGAGRATARGDPTGPGHRRDRADGGDPGRHGLHILRGRPGQRLLLHQQHLPGLRHRAGRPRHRHRAAQQGLVVLPGRGARERAGARQASVPHADARHGHARR